MTIQQRPKDVTEARQALDHIIRVSVGITPILAAADVLALAVLERMLELRSYTCSATCDHHEDYCPRPHVEALRAEIEGSHEEHS